MPPPPSMPTAVADIMKECCSAEPEKRPTAEKLKEMLEQVNKKTNARVSASVVTTIRTERTRSKSIESK